MKPAPPGGPSTFYGVLYQLLWALATLGGFRTLRYREVEGQIDQITLVLEPSDGGDQHALTDGKRTVTQLKARGSGGTWSLQEVVCEVLPDLYLAVDESCPDSVYQFVTEGRRGGWAAVEQFFSELEEPPDGVDLLATLDDVAEVPFRRNRAANPFWGTAPVTRRGLFQKIVSEVRKRKPTADEVIDVTVRKVWLLLRGFRLVGGESHESLRVALDAWLLVRVGSADRIRQKADGLLLDLARRACSGNATVHRADFFAHHGLEGTPLTAWFTLTRNAVALLSRRLQTKRMDLDDEVRPSLTGELAADWTAHSPVLVLTGPSGCGKTWHAYAALAAAGTAGEVVIAVNACDDADRDLESASHTFWHEIAEYDDKTPFERLRARLRQVDKANESRRFCLLVDNVTNLDEARRLVEKDWETLGARLVFTCQAEIADPIRATLGHRGRVADVPDFDLGQLHYYLAESAGVSWESVPYDVRRTLCRPLLARLFRDVVTGDDWQPRNEYELYERSSDQARQSCADRFSIAALRTLAAGVLLDGAVYPWPADVLQKSGVTSDGLRQLTRCGWLRVTADERYEVWHDRLLNWAVADGIAHLLRADAARVEPVARSLARFLREPRATCGRLLGYVAMDVLWILSDPRMLTEDLARRLVAEFKDALGERVAGELLRRLIPTLGSRARPILAEQLRAAAGTGPAYVVNNVLAGLIATGDEGLERNGAELLTECDGKLRRTGALLLARRPDATQLPQLWNLHVDGVANPSRYCWPGDHSRSVYGDTFDALRANAPLNPNWLEHAIVGADPLTEPIHDLAYLVSIVGDAELWRQCKPALMAKVNSGHLRSLATCIGRFRDATELSWLDAHIADEDDLTGVVSLRALAAIDPHRALGVLDHISEGHLYATRVWTFSELHARLPEEVMAWLSRRLRSHDRPWRFVSVIQGREDLIDPELLDFLLDRLTELLVAAMSSEPPEHVLPDIRFATDFLMAIGRPILLDCLRRRRSSSLERALTNYSVLPSPESGTLLHHDKREGLDVLARIGGDGFNQVLDSWMDRGDRHARMHAVQLTRRRLTAGTAERLSRLSSDGDPADTPDNHAALRGYAAAALATHGCMGPVFAYLLLADLNDVTFVARYCLELPPAPRDENFDSVLRDFRASEGPTPGSILAIGLSGRVDLLPEIRDVLRRADLGSDVAAACMVTLAWMRDTSASTVPVIARHLSTRADDATNALLANGNAEALDVLAAQMRARSDSSLAVVVAEDPRHRNEAIEAIRRIASDPVSARHSGIIRRIASECSSGVLRAVADCQPAFALAEEIGFSAYMPSYVPGDKPAALRIIGTRQPGDAATVAIARLRDRSVPDADLYPPLIGDLVPDRAVPELLEAALDNLPLRVEYAIGRELRRLRGDDDVAAWLADQSPERRLVACRLSGFLRPTPDLRLAVRSLLGDTDQRVATAAAQSLDRLRRQEIVIELVEAFNAEVDPVHKWVLLDAVVAVADPGQEGTPPYWIEDFQDRLTPAMELHLVASLKKRRDKLLRDLAWRDRD